MSSKITFEIDNETVDRFLQRFDFHLLANQIASTLATLPRRRALLLEALPPKLFSRFCDAVALSTPITMTWEELQNSPRHVFDERCHLVQHRHKFNNLQQGPTEASRRIREPTKGSSKALPL